MALSLNVPSSAKTSYTIYLDNNSYRLTFTWIVRASIWSLDMETPDGTKLITGTSLVPNVELNRVDKGIAPKGSLVLINRTASVENPTRFNIGPRKDFELVYFTEEEINAN